MVSPVSLCPNLSIRYLMWPVDICYGQSMTTDIFYLSITEHYTGWERPFILILYLGFFSVTTQIAQEDYRAPGGALSMTCPRSLHQEIQRSLSLKHKYIHTCPRISRTHKFIQHIKTYNILYNLREVSNMGISVNGLDLANSSSAMTGNHRKKN